MKLHVLSDIHLEMRDWKHFVQQMLPGGDVLVLPGDILYLKFFDQIKPIFEAFCQKYKKVFYVPGNHEFYTSKVSDSLNILAEVKKLFPNLSVLETGSVETYEGRRFIGATMWFRDHPMNRIYQRLLNDFFEIKGFVPWVYNENSKFLQFLQQELKKDDVVITHHLPTHLSIPRAYSEDSINRFFVCEVSELILDRQPALWLHGHTHSVCDYKLENTRVYCNPLGYPKEYANLDWKSKIEVEL